MYKILLPFLIILMCVDVSYARRRRTPLINNSRIAREDVVYVDSLDVVYSPIFWQADGGVKSLLLQANDTTSAGFAGDSCVVSVELFQVFDYGAGHVVLLKSRAHPDSVTFPYGSDFVLFDSLNILAMDTTSYWTKVSIPNININGDTAGVYYNDSLNAVATAPYAFTYLPIVPDYSPGLVLKFTGLAGNVISGNGSKWIVKWFQENGQPVTGQ